MILPRKIKRLLLFIFISSIIFFLVSLLKSNSNPFNSMSVRELKEFRQRRYLKSLHRHVNGPGENGASVELSKEEKAKYQLENKKEGFNVIASRKISLDRSLPDRRDPLCNDVKYDIDKYPSASVVIIYYNEEWTAILRTVHSVVNRSPPQLLHEVLLVDDSSTRPELSEPLKNYLRKTFPDNIVRIVRTPERSGLIRAKIFGAEQARGQVLIFLDAHCEAAEGWIEPLLKRIYEKNSAVLCPMIDVISSSSMAYYGGGSGSIGGFSWSMHFTWENIPDFELKRRKSRVEPIRSPTMAGGLLAVDRKFFFHIGAYDSGMDIWGGENLEMSFRVWQCGGSLEFIPCSRVGHIFRDTHPYGFPSKTYDYHGINSRRVAEVWMDEYKKFFYSKRKDLLHQQYGDVSSRLALRKKLNCHPFSWYLKNVYPQKFIPDENVEFYGKIRNPSTNFCVDTLQGNVRREHPLGVYFCQDSHNQIFSLTSTSQFRTEETCARLRKKNDIDFIHMIPCTSTMSGGDHFKIKGQQLIHIKSELCMDFKGLKMGSTVLLNPCDDSLTQKFEFIK